MPFNIEEPKRGYLIHQVNSEFILCRIIRICKDEEEAIQKLLEILDKQGEINYGEKRTKEERQRY